LKQAAEMHGRTNVDAATQSWSVIVGWTVAVVFIVFGIGLMFANPENIERPAIVGGFTCAGGLLAGALMLRTQSVGGPFNWWQIFGFMIVALACFAWGRLIDYVLGPAPVDREADEETLGAHLSD
jgi:hypothetical protein